VHWVRRAWSLPLWVHAGALLAVLIGVLALSGPAVPFSTDEGAAVIQARTLEHNGSWLLPTSQLDPAGIARPFPHGDHGTLGTAAYGKHPAYPLLLEAADKAGGMAGVRLLSVLGAWLAAIGAALLGRRLGTGIDRSCLWLIGVGSPLFVDSGLVLAHTLAAAAAVLAVVAVLDVLRGRHPWLNSAIAAVLTAATVALRSEGVFLVPALVVAIVVMERSRRSFALVGGLVASGAAVVATEHVFLRHTVGSVIGGGQQSGSLVGGRIQGFVHTWLDVSYTRGVGALLLFVAIGALTVGALLMRRQHQPALARALLIAGAAAYVMRLFVDYPATVPGLLVAFPLGWVAFLLMRRQDVGNDGRLPMLVAGVVVGGVLATQYAIGGGVEWGGRYFALVLPLVAPAIVVCLRRVNNRVLLSSLAVSMAALAVFGVATLRHTHAATSDVVLGVRDVARQLHGPPVVVSTSRLLPQLDWRGFDAIQWVTPTPDDLSEAGRQLAVAHVNQFVLVGDDPHAQLTDLPDYEMAPAQPSANRVIPMVILQRKS
jgi:hypothetical protein